MYGLLPLQPNSGRWYFHPLPHFHPCNMAVLVVQRTAFSTAVDNRYGGYVGTPAQRHSVHTAAYVSGCDVLSATSNRLRSVDFVCPLICRDPSLQVDTMFYPVYVEEKKKKEKCLRFDRAPLPPVLSSQRYCWLANFFSRCPPKRLNPGLRAEHGRIRFDGVLFLRKVQGERQPGKYKCRRTILLF